MKKYRFTPELNQKIVDGILNGYKNYLDERTEKREKMKISEAYAWVKGNHIDDQTAIQCEKEGIEYMKARAGYSWGYLEFSTDEKSMFIIKNGRYFNDKELEKKGIPGRNEKNYLTQLSKINEHIEFSEREKQEELLLDEQENQTLSIFDEKTMEELEDTVVSRLQKKYNKFYVVTYDIDEAYMISKIRVMMLKPDALANEKKAYEVEDLSDLIKGSPVDFSNTDMSVVAQDVEENGYTSTHYGVVLSDEIADENKSNEG